MHKQFLKLLGKRRIGIFFLSAICVLGFLLPENNAFAQNPSSSINLSLDEAILLAVRENPSVQVSRLTLILEKFNLFVEKWRFYPQYSFTAEGGTSSFRSFGGEPISTKKYNAKMGISLLTPIGTQITLSGTNAVTNQYNPGVTLSVVQPLIRGFGKAVVETALNNAKDTELVSRMNIEGTLRGTVTAVINAYLEVISAEKTIEIDRAALARAQDSVVQTKLFIKAGHKAGNELVTVQANVASAQMQLENDKNSLTQMQFALLTSIGLNPNAKFNFSNINLKQLIAKYALPSMVDAKELILKNDIQYQTAQIMLYGSSTRNLLIAEDNTRPKLNLSANFGSGNGSAGGQNAGVNSLFNGANQTNGVALILQIPIDDQLSKQALLSAKIAIKKARIGLQEMKWAKEITVTNAWNTVVSAKRALVFAQSAAELQKKTYNISYQKYLHGLIDSLEWQTAQTQLVQAQQTMLNAMISYLKALVNLDLLIGNTLQTWKIAVRT